MPGTGYTATRSENGAPETVTILPGGPDLADSGGVLQISKQAVALQTVSVSKGNLHFSLRIAAALGQVVRIEASADLKQWTSLGFAQPAAGGGLEFNDTSTNDFAPRYCRAVTP